MSSSLKEKCGKFINNKYPNTYRNTIDYINKTNMKNNGVWGGDLELFTAGLLFNIDIWVYSKETGNSPLGVPDYDKFKTSTTGWLLSPDPLCTTVY